MTRGAKSLIERTINIRAGSMEGFQTFLFELGIDPIPVLKKAGLSHTVLSQPETLIPADNFRLALNLAAEASGLRTFGLLLSQRQSFEKLGVLGYLVRHAPNLGVSLDRLIRHFRTHDNGSLTRVEVNGDCALWIHRLAGLGDVSAIQQTELAIGLGSRFIRSALGETWMPHAIYFEHNAPPDVSAFAKVFRCPVHFNQPLTAIEFKASDLDAPMRLSDPGLFAILEEHIARVDASLGTAYPVQVRQAIENNIESGHIRLADIAANLGIKAHVLQRRLKAQGTSYQEILDDSRYALARRYLRETGLRISDIASILRYSESAVFTRAFSRRAGQSPRSWRNGNHSNLGVQDPYP